MVVERPKDPSDEELIRCFEQLREDMYSKRLPRSPRREARRLRAAAVYLAVALGTDWGDE